MAGQDSAFHAELAADRDALLAIVSGIDDKSLALETRNAGWAVRDVLAHVIAVDTELIATLEAAVDEGSRVNERSMEEYESEIARWVAATASVLVQELQARGERWRGLLSKVPASGLDEAAGVWWTKGMLRDVVESWRDHDKQHAEDVRLSLEQRSALK